MYMYIYIYIYTYMYRANISKAPQNNERAAMGPQGPLAC